MKSGVIGLPDFDFGPIKSFSEQHQVNEDTSLQACLEVRRTDEADAGFTFQTGRAALQALESEEQVRINQSDNSINVVEDANVVKTNYTEFIIVPGEFVAVRSGNGTFAFQLISGQTDAATIKRAEIDLTGLANSYEDESRAESATPWQVGFYGNSGGADKGTLYGNNVFTDSDFGEYIRDLPKNQLGLELDNGKDSIKMTAAESGYVEVYQPSNYDSEEFAEFIINHILQHTDRRA